MNIGPCTECKKTTSDFPEIQTIEPDGLVGWNFCDNKWFCPDCNVTLVVRSRNKPKTSYYYSLGTHEFVNSDCVTKEFLIEEVGKGGDGIDSTKLELTIHTDIKTYVCQQTPEQILEIIKGADDLNSWHPAVE